MNSLYQRETKRRWGKSREYPEADKLTSEYSKEDWGQIQTEADDIYAEFLALKDTELSSEIAYEVVERWQNHISTYYYKCSEAVLAGLGEMYAADDRFRENIDKQGKGISQIMSDAIKAYGSR